MAAPFPLHRPAWLRGNYDIQTGQSIHHHDRTGIFMDRDIKKYLGHVKMFKSSGNLLAVIGDDEVSITRTCDYCFNTQYKTADGIQISTSLKPKVRIEITETETSSQQSTNSSVIDNPPEEVNEGLKTCARCRMVYYCNKKCQKKAWYQHHKRECETLAGSRAKAMREWAEMAEADTKHEEDTEEDETEKEDIYYDVFDNLVRLAIRFVLVFKVGQPADATDGPLDHLFWNLNQRPLDPEAQRKSHAIARLVKDVTNAPFTESEIDGWVRMLVESRREMKIPILKDACHPPHIGSMVSPGWFVDPVLSMVQHSCEPNSRAVVEGGKIWVLALKDIPANGEVTFNYVPEYLSYDYAIRVDALHLDWNIHCSCSICKKGPSLVAREEWPSFARLITDTSWHTMDEPSYGPGVIDRVDWWIPRLEGMGYGPGGEYFPFYRRLWYIRLAHRYNQKLYKETLHACLKLYVEIEPGHVGDEQRIDSLYLLCNLLNPEACDRRIKDEGWIAILADIGREFPGLSYCLRERYCKMLHRCFGHTSPISQYEEDSYRQHLVQTEQEEGWRRRLAQDQINWYRENMRDSMNELLNWVGHPIIVELRVSDELFGWGS